MGREALCHAEWPGGAGEVKALLETHELIVRGDLRRTFPLAALAEVIVDGDRLAFRADGEPFALTLGADIAASWAKKIATPPPTLAAKLGIGAVTRVRVIGTLTDPELVAAIGAATVDGDADLAVAEVADAAALDNAVKAAGAIPLWLAYAKGKASSFGEAAIRDAMRDRGWIDVKVASVSGRLTATKFTRRR